MPRAELAQRQADGEHDHRTGDRADQLGVRDAAIEPGRDGARLDDLADRAVGTDRLAPALARDHLARDPADQAGADQRQPGIALQQARDDGGTGDDDRHADHQSHAHQEEVALGGGGDGDRIVEAHHRVGEGDAPDRGPQLLMRLDLTAFLLVADQLDADPQQQQAAHQLEVRHVEQHAQHGAEDDQQHDRTRAAEHDRGPAVLLGEIARRHGDHHGVVARQDHIGDHDLPQRHPEDGAGEIRSHEMHEVPPIGAGHTPARGQHSHSRATVRSEERRVGKELRRLSGRASGRPIEKVTRMASGSGYSKMFPVSWTELHRDARALAWRLADLGPFKGLVAITRGGLVPAAIIARELDIRLNDTVCSSTHDRRERGAKVELRKGTMAEQDKGKGWLIVDNLVDTGVTAKAVRAMLPEAHFATVYAKPAGRPTVDSYITEVSQDTWILFPWDQEAVMAKTILEIKGGQ